MNTQDELERMLTHELHGRADGLGGAGFGFADVKGRAGRIRRNRRLAAGAGVAAAMAIVIPTVVSAGGLLSGDGRQVDPAVPSPAPVEVARTTLTLDGLPRGEEPRVEYFTPDGVVLPGEGLRELPYNYNALVPSPADGGWLAWEGASLDVRYLSESFEQQGGSATNNSFVSNPDRSLVAWVMPEAGAQTLYLHSTTDPSVDRSWDFGGVSTIDPVDFVSDESLLFSAHDDRTGEVEAGIAGADGKVRLLPDVVKPVSASPVTGLVAAQTKSNKDASGCFGVLDPASSTTRPVWSTCDYSLGAFSPDGEYLLASSAYGDGYGITSVSVLDADTGDLVATFTQASDTQVNLMTVVWESADTFVAVGLEGTVVEGLRFGVDGTLEQVTETYDGEAFGDLPIWFGGDRRRGY